MRPQFAEQRFVVIADGLSDDRDSEPRIFGYLGLHCCVKSVRVLSGGIPKSIQLVRCPKVSRQLFNELRGQIYPIEMFELVRDRNLRKRMHPLNTLFD